MKLIGCNIMLVIAFMFIVQSCKKGLISEQLLSDEMKDPSSLRKCAITEGVG